MGVWSDHLLPRLLAVGMGQRKFAEQEAGALKEVSGRVLELGFGAGLNLPHDTGAVTEVLAVEPAQVNRKLARRRVEASPISPKSGSTGRRSRSRTGPATRRSAPGRSARSPTSSAPSARCGACCVRAAR